MIPYDRLTDAGRLRRLARLGRTALARWPVDVASVRLLAEHTNAIFRVDTVDGARYALRVCAPRQHSRDEHEIEADWTAAVAAQTPVRVPVPVRSRDGGFVVEASDPGVPEPRLCTLATWVPGRPIEESPAHFRLLGAAMALLHVQALGYAPPAGLAPMVWDRAFYWVHEPVSVYDDHGLLGPDDVAAVRHAQVVVDATLARLHADPAHPRRIIHADLHTDNAHVARGRLWVIDFEDLVVGVPAQDVASALYPVRFREDFTLLAHALRDGYSTVAPWPVEDAGTLDVLVAARALMLLNYCVNERSDPDLAAFVPVLAERVRRLVPGTGLPPILHRSAGKAGQPLTESV
ncbi:MAG: phosphotransferase enzyme family protein [Kineosporiaceae bacterium]